MFSELLGEIAAMEGKVKADTGDLPDGVPLDGYASSARAHVVRTELRADGVQDSARIALLKVDGTTAAAWVVEVPAGGAPRLRPIPSTDAGRAKVAELRAAGAAVYKACSGAQIDVDGQWFFVWQGPLGVMSPVLVPDRAASVLRVTATAGASAAEFVAVVTYGGVPIALRAPTPAEIGVAETVVIGGVVEIDGVSYLVRGSPDGFAGLEQAPAGAL